MIDGLEINVLPAFHRLSQETGEHPTSGSLASTSCHQLTLLNTSQGVTTAVTSNPQSFEAATLKCCPIRTTAYEDTELNQSLYHCQVYAGSCSYLVHGIRGHRNSYTTMSGAGYDVVVDVDDEVSFISYCILPSRQRPGPNIFPP